MTEAASGRKGKEPGKRLSRRDFLRLGGVAAAVGTVGILTGKRILGTPNVESTIDSKVKYGMVIDLERCVGCRSCMEACKVENNTPKASFWMYVFRLEEGTYPNVNTQFLPRPCMHCDNAPCVKVCPVGARHYGDNKIVLTDFEACIGCRYCMVACPYSVNNFNWKHPKDNQYYDWKNDEGAGVYGEGSVNTYLDNAIPPYENPDHDKRYGSEQRLVAGSGHYLGIIEKCTFCVHRVVKGLLPACVDNCPVRTLHFGDLNDPSSEVTQILAKKRSFRLLEELGTEPKVYYVGGAPPSEAMKQFDSISREVPWGRVR